MGGEDGFFQPRYKKPRGGIQVEGNLNTAPNIDVPKLTGGGKPALA